MENALKGFPNFLIKIDQNIDISHWMCVIKKTFILDGFSSIAKNLKLIRVNTIEKLELVCCPL